MGRGAQGRDPAGRMYNVVVIGGGTAGLVTAAATAGLGGRVALIERDRMGGDCLNTGCVPSKALISSARLIDQMRHADRWGVEPREPEFSFPKVMERMRERRARIAPHDSRERFEGLGVEVIPGEARFVSANEVRVGERSLRARNFVVAAGSRPAVPKIAGLANVPFYTNQTIFDRLREKPSRLAVLGGGPIGCELGQAFARLGVRVTVLQRGPQILPREDRDVVEVLVTQLASEGIEVRTKAEVREAAFDGTEIRLDLGGGEREPIRCDALLVATGRTPNVERLDLEAAGVAYTPRGITVDDHLRTSQRHIYAAGDIAGRYKFTHVADHHARTVVRNILLPWFPAKVENTVVPWCTYTSPEIARVGVSEGLAAAKGIACDVFRLPMSDVDRAIVERTEEGFAKVLTRKRSGEILGATIVAEGAGDLLQVFAVAMKSGIGLGGISRAIQPYPTRGELAHRIADRQRQTRLTAATKRVLRWLFRRRRRE